MFAVFGSLKTFWFELFRITSGCSNHELDMDCPIYVWKFGGPFLWNYACKPDSDQQVNLLRDYFKAISRAQCGLWPMYHELWIIDYRILAEPSSFNLKSLPAISSFPILSGSFTIGWSFPTIRPCGLKISNKIIIGWIAQWPTQNKPTHHGSNGIGCSTFHSYFCAIVWLEIYKHAFHFSWSNFQNHFLIYFRLKKNQGSEDLNWSEEDRTVWCAGPW